MDLTTFFLSRGIRLLALLVLVYLVIPFSAAAGYRAVDTYHANELAKILNGASPGSLKQLFEDPLEIGVNFGIARHPGFKIPATLLRIAVEKYEE